MRIACATHDASTQRCTAVRLPHAAGETAVRRGQLWSAAFTCERTTATMHTACRLQKATVLATCEHWIAETTAHGDRSRAGRMRGHLSKIRELLNAL